MIASILFIVFSVLFGFMQTTSIYAGDSGGLVSAGYTWGIAHPPGYPLYCFLTGLLTHGIPIGTVAWRAGFLSSFPMALSVVLVYLIVVEIARLKPAGVIAACFYGVLYPVWLYAIVPEVFGLYAMFSACILYLFIRLVKTEKTSYLSYLAFLSGLSLTHHHMILLLLLPLVYGSYRWYPKMWKLCLYRWKTILFFGLLGMSVYLYAPVVSSFAPPFDREHPATLSGFIRLITRASFGTFKASYSTGFSLKDRLFNVATFLHFIIRDMQWIGIIGMGIGFLTLWKQYRKVFFLLSLYFGLLIFFFFYAGFPVESDFFLGTIERFFIVPYQVGSILFGIGIAGSIAWIGVYWNKHARNVHVPLACIHIMLFVLVFLPVVRNIILWFPRLLPLRDDRTLERFTDDLFASIPNGAILALMDDTTGFSVDYAYFVQKKRQDISYVSLSMLHQPTYRLYLKKTFPSLSIPAPDVKPDIITAFIRENSKERAIAADRSTLPIPTYWVPWGLVFLSTPDQSFGRDPQVFLKNLTALWDQFSDPASGALGVYRHMLLTDVVRFIAEKRMLYGKTHLVTGNISEAVKQFTLVMASLPEELSFRGQSIAWLTDEQQCTEALQLFSRHEYDIGMHPQLFFAAQLWVKNCPQEAEQEGVIKKEYERLSNGSQSIAK